MGIEFEGVTLDNVAEGELEAQFQDVLAKVVEAFAEPELYEHSSGMMKCSVVAEIVFYRHAETQAVHVGARAAFKAPKRKEAIRAAWVREGGVLVEKEKQEDLPFEDGNVTPLRNEEGGEA